MIRAKAVEIYAECSRLMNVKRPFAGYSNRVQLTYRQTAAQAVRTEAGINFHDSKAILAMNAEEGARALAQILNVSMAI
jgi:hypothetical protein